MSNLVYGYIVNTNQAILKDALNKKIIGNGLGYQEIATDELYGFYDELKPKIDHLNHFCINISDKQNSNVAECLIDFYDYDSTVKMELPHSGLQRLHLLIDIILSILELSIVCQIVIAFTECNEIESTVTVNKSEFRDILIGDFTKYAPPNKVYKIFK